MERSTKYTFYWWKQFQFIALNSVCMYLFIHKQLKWICSGCAWEYWEVTERRWNRIQFQTYRHFGVCLWAKHRSSHYNQESPKSSPWRRHLHMSSCMDIHTQPTVMLNADTWLTWDIPALSCLQSGSKSHPQYANYHLTTQGNRYLEMGGDFLYAYFSALSWSQKICSSLILCHVWAVNIFMAFSNSLIYFICTPLNYLCNCVMCYSPSNKLIFLLLSKSFFFFFLLVFWGFSLYRKV